MNKDVKAETVEQLRRENEELRLRLFETQATLNAIRNIHEDTFAEKGVDIGNIISSSLSETSAQTFFEKMREGALLLSTDGRIMYCNSHFARLMNMTVEKVIGSKLDNFISPLSTIKTDRLLKNSYTGLDHVNILFQPVGQYQTIQLRLSLNTFSEHETPGEIGIILTDVSAYKLIEDDAAGEHTLEIQVSGGKLKAYTFTFG